MQHSLVVHMDVFRPSGKKFRKTRRMSNGGFEIWGEEVEKLFKQGLSEFENMRKENDTVKSHQRGRNQYMVSYLEKNGINRTKKQVASHIQVLRHAWRDTSDSHLVAGSDAPTSPSAKDEDDLAGISSHPSSPRMHPYRYGSPSEFPDSPGSSEGMSPPPTFSDALEPLSGPSRSNRSRSHSLPQRTHSRKQSQSDSDWIQLQQPAPVIPYSFFPAPIPQVYEDPIHNRMCSLCLWADGMSAFTVAINPPTNPNGRPTRVVVPLEIRVPPLTDPDAPVTLHGFRGSVKFAKPWQSSAQCKTSVYANDILTAEEHAEMYMRSSTTDADFVESDLPSSPLTTCRYYENSDSNKITQQIIVDSHVLGIITYTLHRETPAGPEAHVPSVWQSTEVQYFTLNVPPPPTHFPLPSSPHLDGELSEDHDDRYETHSVLAGPSAAQVMSRPRALTSIPPSLLHSNPDQFYNNGPYI